MFVSTKMPDVFPGVENVLTVQRVNIPDIDIPPLKFKVLVKSECNQTTTSSTTNNHLDERRYNETVA